MTRARKWKRVAFAAVVAAVGLELLYVATANIVLATGVPEHLANQRPEVIQLSYRWAFTPWPGRVYARDVAFRFQDDNVAFSFAMATSRLDIALTDLFSRKLTVKHARGTNLSYRMLLKVDSDEGMEERVLAFPPIAGVARPALRPAPVEETALTAAEIDRLWSLEFNDIESEVAEVWLFEYRYRGRGHSNGSFGIAPMRQLWIGPVSLTLEEGELTVGRHLVSERFSLSSDAKLAPVSIATAPGLEVFGAITGTVRLALPLSSLEFATVYLPGAKARGGGALTADVRLKDGHLEPTSVLKAELPGVHVGYRGFGFEGGVSGALTVAEKPVARAIAQGTVFLPMPEARTLTATVAGVTGTLSLASSDLSQGVQLGWLHAGIAKAEATDARPLVAVASAKVPFFANQLLGDGPLTTAGTLDVNSHQTVLRVSSAKLGSADLHGAIALRAQKWNGAAAGHAGILSVGIHLDDGVPSVLPFVAEGWLDEQLASDGLLLAPSNPAVGHTWPTRTQAHR